MSRSPAPAGLVVRRRSWRRGPVECRELGKVLQAHLDGHLEEGYDALVRRHLEACRHCGLEAETYRRIKASLERADAGLDAESVERLRRFGRSLLTEPPD